MIDSNALGLIELILTGAIVLGFGGWQLWTVRHDLPWRRRDPSPGKDSSRDPGHPEG